MKLILTCATALSLLAGAALAETWKTIRKEADFVAAIAGKQLTWDGGKGILNADGTTSGTSKQIGKYAGNWVWQGRFYCRNLAYSGGETGTNCQKVEVSGNKLRLTRDKGKGNSVIIQIN